MYKNHSTLWWIYILAGITMILIFISRETRNFWTFVFSGITVAILLIVSFYALVQWLRKRNWAHILQTRFPNWFYRNYFRHYLHMRYGLKCTIPKPVIQREFRDNKGTGAGAPQTYYTVTIQVIISKKDKYPINIDFGAVSLCLRHKVEWRRVVIDIATDSGERSFFTQTKNQNTYHSHASTNIPGDDSEQQIAIQCSNWGVRGIYVTIRGKRRELWKGIYHIPIRRIRDGIL